LPVFSFGSRTPFIENLCQRALRYLSAGQAVHLSGPAGTGKTTIAMHIASLLGRPVMVLHGDAEHERSDLVGSADGYQRTHLVDNFIHSVIKSEESFRKVFVADRLTMACRLGYTLIYDEFTRSRPEANNVLLSILGERVLDLPEAGSGGTYLRVAPSFAAIFTSNPEEYVGTHSCQDALLDRMVTLNLCGYDLDTETAIVVARSGLPAEDASVVVRIARAFGGKDGLRHRSTALSPWQPRQHGTSAATHPLAERMLARPALGTSRR
jgi:gas vesicle protein GvpN